MTRLPGPHQFTHNLFWVYRTVERICAAEMKLSEVSMFGQVLVLNSKNMFSADLYGARMLLAVYLSMILRILKQVNVSGEDRFARISLNILAQIVSIPAGFAVMEDRKGRLRIPEPALELLARYKRVQKDISPFVELAMSQSASHSNKFSEEGQCMGLWVTALHYLQNTGADQHFEFVRHLLQQLTNRIDNDVFDKKRVPALFALVDIIELFIWAHRSDAGPAQTKSLSALMNSILQLASDKVPTENSTQHRKLVAYMQHGYERIVCGLIQLALLVANSLSGTVDETALADSLKALVMKCRRFAETDKARVFNVAKVERAALAALNFVVLNRNRQRITSTFPLPSTSFCNDFPRDIRNSLFDPQRIGRVSFLSGDGDRLITLVELASQHNGLYDGVAVVRDEHGTFAYRAEMLVSLEQLRCPVGKPHSESYAAAHEEVGGKTALGSLFVHRPIERIMMTEDDAAVQDVCSIMG